MMVSRRTSRTRCGVEFAFEVLQEGLQDARFGLAAIEDTEALVEGVGWGWFLFP